MRTNDDPPLYILVPIVILTLIGSVIIWVGDKLRGVIR